MIAIRWMLAMALVLGLSSGAQAQGTQCRTDPIGSRSSNCASDTFVTDSIAAAPQGTVKEVDTAGLASGGPITSIGTVTVTAAAKSDQQAASSAVLAVTPSQQQSHPSAAKGWVFFNGTAAACGGGTCTAGNAYNTGTLTRSGAGNYTVNWTTSFTSANYAVIIQCNDNGSGAGSVGLLETIAAGSVGFICINPSTLAAGDASKISVVAFGTQ